MTMTSITSITIETKLATETTTSKTKTTSKATKTTTILRLFVPMASQCLCRLDVVATAHREGTRDRTLNWKVGSHLASHSVLSC